MNNRVINVAAIQHSCSVTVEDNRQTTAALIRTAAANGAGLIVLQELHQTRYFCQSENTAFFDLAESIPGPGTNHFAALARELGVVIVLSLFEKRAAGLYHNTAVVLDSNGEIAGRYRKMHIPDDPGFYEKFYFTPGDLGFTPIQTRVGKLGVLVEINCETDRRSDLLGPVVSGGRAPDGPGWRRVACLPDGDWLGSE